MSVRVQAWGIIAAVLADTDPAGAAVRQRLSNSLDENPGVPERALLEYLLETRRSDANMVETLDTAREMRLTPPALPPKPSAPATPKELGGASFSATILMSCGIRVGAVNWLFINSD